MAHYKQIIDTALVSGKIVPSGGHGSLILFRDEEQIVRWASLTGSSGDDVRIVTVPLSFLSSIVAMPQPIERIAMIGVATSQRSDLGDTILKSYRFLRLD